MVEKLAPHPFLKNWNRACLTFNTVCFYSMPSWGLLTSIETKLQTSCLYLILSFCKKNKEVLNKSSCLIFCIIFQEKYLIRYVILIDQVSLSGCRNLWNIGQDVYCSCLLTRLDAMNFQTNLTFLIKSFYQRN